jgi:hypothetical protein
MEREGNAQNASQAFEFALGDEVGMGGCLMSERPPKFAVISITEKEP